MKFGSLLSARCRHRSMKSSSIEGHISLSTSLVPSSISRTRPSRRNLASVAFNVMFSVPNPRLIYVAPLSVTMCRTDGPRQHFNLISSQKRSYYVHVK